MPTFRKVGESADVLDMVGFNFQKTNQLLKKKNIDYYMNLPYNIIIRKDPYGGYFAKVEELEGCMTQGETYEEAFKNIREAMELWLEVALEDGDKIPEPVSDEKFSGKFVPRIAG